MNCHQAEDMPVNDTIEARLGRLEAESAHTHARLSELAALPEIVLVVQECIIDLADAIEEIRGEAPEGLNQRLERLEQLCDMILEIDRAADQA
jgi:hypothetical protein